MQYLAMVRYGILTALGEFHTKIEGLKQGDVVVIRSNRGIEFGEIVQVLGETTKEFKEDAPDEIVRLADDNDKKKHAVIEEETVPGERKYCQKKIQELKVPMKLIGIEHLFDEKKIIIYYIAEKRIDFRELVKDLAREFHARIEMKQIGVRDEARMLAFYQHCGRELCCRSFLKNLDPVAMKMAKRQKATMDPAKISGRCGKLMCCLRYEDAVYEELKNNLPKKGALVKTEKCEGEVLDYEILSQNVLIETKEGNKLTISAKDIIGQKNAKQPVKLSKKKNCQSTCKK